METVLVIVLAIIVFTLAGIIYWRMLRILALLVQIGAYIAGIAVALDLKDDGLIGALLAGTGVYLLISSLVLIFNRIGSLEKEVVRLGGRPNTPDLVQFLLSKLRGSPEKPKNTPLDQVSNRGRGRV